jgi:hypothetical protein
LLFCTPIMRLPLSYSTEVGATPPFHLVELFYACRSVKWSCENHPVYPIRPQSCKAH